MQWQVPLFDPDLGQQEVDAVGDVIRSKWLTMGERTSEFETRFARMVGCANAVAVSNCTAGLHLALLAVGVRPGDEVICPSLTFVATANAVRYCGAVPIFADIASLDDWNVSRSTIEPLLTDRTRAVIVLHYAGYVCEMAPIIDLARARGLAVVEDAAHAPGATRDGRAAGAWGDAGCFSFFPNKNMTTGEGGMVTTGREEIAERLRRTRTHGMTTLTLDRHKGHAFTYDVVEAGFNYRMSELNAVLGLVQLDQLEARNRRRQELVALYRRKLAAIPGLTAPFGSTPGEPAFHIMPALLPEGADRQAVMQKLRDDGIQTSIHYRPVDTFTAYRDAGLGPGQHLGHTHAVGERMVTLPLYPSMGDARVELVCRRLAAALGR